MENDSPEDRPSPKRKRAVALQYDADDHAPKVIATGAGELARRILALADEHNVPVSQNDTLVELLSQLDLHQEIPEEAYRAVAAILAFLYRADEEWKRKKLKQEPVSDAKPLKKSADKAKPTEAGPEAAINRSLSSGPR